MALPAGLSKRNGVYYVRFKRDGRWTRKAAGRNLRRALELHELLRDASSAVPPQGRSKPPVRFEIAVDRWLRDQRLRNKPTTIKSSKARSRKLLTHFGGRDLHRIREDDLRAYIGKRRKQVGDVTVNCELRILKAILRFAASEGLIDELPCRIRMLRCTNRRSITIFKPNEIATVLESAPPKIQMLLLVAASTGLRLDEILHLKWSDIDWSQSRIDVTAKRYRHTRRSGEVVELDWSPKSHQERSVFVNPGMVTALEEYRDTLECASDDDWVFQGRRSGSRLVSPHKAIRVAFQDAGIYEKRKLTHAIRHSVATTMLRKGVDLETLRDVLGHAQLSTTALYLHAEDERKRRAAETLDLVSPTKARRSA